MTVRLFCYNDERPMIFVNKLELIRIIKRSAVFYLILIYALSSCSIHKKKELAVEPVLNFPLIQDSEVCFEGEINRVITQSENRVYFSSSKGGLYCIEDPKQGIQRLFTSEIDFASPPYISGEYIFVYDSMNNIYCIRKDGVLSWKTHIEENISGGIAASHGKIFFGTENGNFLSYDADSGKYLWGVETEGPIRSLPIVMDDTVVFGSDDKKLYLLNLDGDIIKEYETGGEIRGSFVYREDRLYFGSYDEYFYCIHMEKKKIEWRVKTGGKIHAYPLLGEKCVLFPSWDNVLYCLNDSNGTVLWWNPIPARCLFPIEAVGTQLLVTSLSSEVDCFDIKTGEDKGEYIAENELRSNPLWFRDTLLLSVYDKENDVSKILFLIKGE